MRALIAAAVALSACARPSKPARLPEGPLPSPDGIARTTGSFTTKDGLVLFEQCWMPKSAKAVLVIVHGIKDHSSRYHELAVALARAGYATCGFDHRGHGRSAGPRFAIDSFAKVMDDIDQYLEIVRGRVPDRPVFLFGHSMGGAMVPMYAIDRSPALAGIVLSANALRPRIHPFEIAGLSLAAAIFPNASLLDAPDETFSPDPAVVEGMRRDPLIPHGKGTGKMALELANAIHHVWAHVGEIKAPILILSGLDDQAVNPRGSVELHERVGSSDKTLRLYDKAGHDLAHDPRRAAIFADIIAWLDQRTGG